MSDHRFIGVGCAAPQAVLVGIILDTLPRTAYTRNEAPTDEHHSIASGAASNVHAGAPGPLIAMVPPAITSFWGHGG